MGLYLLVLVHLLKISDEARKNVQHYSGDLTAYDKPVFSQISCNSPPEVKGKTTSAEGSYLPIAIKAVFEANYKHL